MENKDLVRFRDICQVRTESIRALMSDGFDSAIKKYEDDQPNHQFLGEPASNSVDVVFLDRISKLGHLDL